MKTYLNAEKINQTVTPGMINETVKLVRSIYTHDRSQPYQNYDCVGRIEISSIKQHGASFSLFTKNGEPKHVKDMSPCNTGTIPLSLLEAAAKDRRKYVYVTIERRVFYYEAPAPYQELRLIIPENRKQLGYFSNRPSISRRGVRFLEGEEFLSLGNLRKRMLLKLHMLALKLHHYAQVFQLAVVHKKAA